MLMSKIAVIGPRDAILAYRALGAEIFPVTGQAGAREALGRVTEQGYQIVFLTEALAVEMQAELASVINLAQPVVTIIPDGRESLGTGTRRLKQRLEKAIGVDILFKGEEKA